jgi:hypothetical protein
MCPRMYMQCPRDISIRREEPSIHRHTWAQLPSTIVTSFSSHLTHRADIGGGNLIRDPQQLRCMKQDTVSQAPPYLPGASALGSLPVSSSYTHTTHTHLSHTLSQLRRRKGLECLSTYQALLYISLLILGQDAVRNLRSARACPPSRLLLGLQLTTATNRSVQGVDLSVQQPTRRRFPVWAPGDHLVRVARPADDAPLDQPQLRVQPRPADWAPTARRGAIHHSATVQ